MTDLPPTDPAADRLAAGPDAAGARGGPRPPFRAVPLRLLIPNLVTLLALCLGLTAIRFAFEGAIEWAVSAIAAAAVLDGLDGRIARALKGTSRFGAELELAGRFRRLRRRAGRRALRRRPRRDEEPRLADGPGLRHRLRAAAGAVQRDARRSVDAGVAQAFLRRHAGPGRRDRRHAAGLFAAAADRRVERAAFRRASRSPMSSSSRC